MNFLEKRYEKIDFFKYFWIFLICSVAGSFYEELMHIIFYFIHHHKFNFSRRRGVFFGPLSPVYGFGGLLLTFLLIRKKKSYPKTFLISFLAGGITEYILSFLQELATGTRSWDYSDKFLNIQGRTTIPYMIFWGILGVLFVKFVYPFITKLLHKIPENVYKGLTIVLLILTLSDITISWTAMARKELRQKGIEPYTFIGELYDKYFTDEYIKKKFPNMKGE